MRKVEMMMMMMIMMTKKCLNRELVTTRKRISYFDLIHLICSLYNPISPYPNLSHLIPSHPISSYTVIPSYIIPSHPLSSHPIPSIQSQLVLYN